MADRPNILLITTDTQRWDTLHCMGSEFAISPNLDKLADEGVLFENGHTSSPVCMPTRCSLMTGVHTHVHGCIENGFSRFDHLPMLPDLLKEVGYYNIMVGKTHFGPVPDSFDVKRITHGGKSSDSDDFYAEFIRKQGYSRSTKNYEPNPVPEDIFMDAFLTTTTIEEIKNAVAGREEPFFAFCSLYSPHGPIDPPGRWATLYDDVSLPEINYRKGEVSEHPQALRELLGLAEPVINREEIDRERRLYYGLSAYCDHQVGRFIQFLEKEELRENTLVIFTSDHGIQLMDHGFSNKHNWYDESWRVPLIMSQPGMLPSSERRGFAIWNDLTATILAAAGTNCDSMQAYDLYTPLTQGEASPREYAVAFLYKSLAVATKKWKLEYYFEDSNGRLFDRLNDPQEQTDLFNSDAHKDIKDKLLHGLLSWYGDASDLKGLVDRSHRGGPIAHRAVDHMKSIKGIESEERLNKVCREVDSL